MAPRKSSFESERQPTQRLALHDCLACVLTTSLLQGGKFRNKRCRVVVLVSHSVSREAKKSMSFAPRCEESSARSVERFAERRKRETFCLLLLPLPVVVVQPFVSNFVIALYVNVLVRRCKGSFPSSSRSVDFVQLNRRRGKKRVVYGGNQSDGQITSLYFVRASCLPVLFCRHSDREANVSSCFFFRCQFVCVDLDCQHPRKLTRYATRCQQG